MGRKGVNPAIWNEKVKEKLPKAVALGSDGQLRDSVGWT